MQRLLENHFKTHLKERLYFKILIKAIFLKFLTKKKKTQKVIFWQKITFFVLFWSTFSKILPNSKIWKKKKQIPELCFNMIFKKY